MKKGETQTKSKQHDNIVSCILEKHGFNLLLDKPIISEIKKSLREEVYEWNTKQTLSDGLSVLKCHKHLFYTHL